jgi:hypothetical protein
MAGVHVILENKTVVGAPPIPIPYDGNQTVAEFYRDFICNGDVRSAAFATMGVLSRPPDAAGAPRVVNWEAPLSTHADPGTTTVRFILEPPPSARTAGAPAAGAGDAVGVFAFDVLSF